MSDVFAFDDSPVWTVKGNAVTANGTDGTVAIWYREPVQNEAKSLASGRPVFDDQILVRLYTPGDMLSVATHPATADIIEKYRESYDKFIAGDDREHVSGTPIEHWPLLNAVERAELKALKDLKIFSVEALAAVADSNLARLPGGRQMRDQAKAWLDQAKDGATATRLAAENTALRETVEDLKRQIADLGKKLEERPSEARAAPAAPAEDFMAQMREMQEQMAAFKAQISAPAYPGIQPDPPAPIERRPPGRPRKDAA